MGEGRGERERKSKSEAEREREGERERDREGMGQEAQVKLSKENGILGGEGAFLPQAVRVCARWSVCVCVCAECVHQVLYERQGHDSRWAGQTSEFPFPIGQSPSSGHRTAKQ